MEKLYHIIIQKVKFEKEVLITLVAENSAAAIVKLQKHPHYHKFLPESIQILTDAEYKEMKLTGWVVFYEGKFHKLHCRILAKDCDEAEKKFKERFPDKEIIKAEAERKKDISGTESKTTTLARIDDLRVASVPA